MGIVALGAIVVIVLFALGGINDWISPVANDTVSISKVILRRGYTIAYYRITVPWFGRDQP